MGRTLHYTVKKSSRLSKAQKDKLYQISVAFNEGKFKGVWTCENFFIDPYGYYPNWNNAQLKAMGAGEAWALINKTDAELTEKYHDREKVVMELVKLGLVSRDIRSSEESEELWGFTKVGGNEYNAYLVLLALLTVSVNIPNEITLHDEGEFLYGPIMIKNGKIKLDKEDALDNIAYWKKEGLLENDEQLQEKKEKIEWLMDFDGGEYTNDIKVFFRKVDPKDFANHPEYGAGQIMAGFHGEYYGLAKEDAEKRSYELTAQIMGALKGALGKDVKVLVGQDITKIKP